MKSSNPEIMLGFVVAMALGLYGLVMLLKWLLTGPAKPDPWDRDVAAKVEDPKTPLLCHRCLVPNDPQADFCENCGAAVGQYTNYLPFPYIFSLGHLLRLGTTGEFRRSRITVLGFILLALAEYTVFAPIYWFQFFRRKPAHWGKGPLRSQPQQS